MAAAQYERPWRRIAADLRAKIIGGRWQAGDRLPTMAQLQSDYSVAKGTIRNAIEQLRTEGLVTTRGGSGIYVNAQEAPPMSNDPSTPVERPIVAAVVTSPLGMLVTWRNDKQPPAGFLTGEIDPGESAEDAMVREVKEESGLRVRAGQIIGDRVHPRSGRRMLYVTGEPIGPADVFVGDEEELAAVRWVSLAEADEAFAPFGGMYPPVHEHLTKILG